MEPLRQPERQQERSREQERVKVIIVSGLFCCPCTVHLRNQRSSVRTDSAKANANL
jgi:hypothetical protein